MQRYSPILKKAALFIAVILVLVGVGFGIRQYSIIQTTKKIETEPVRELPKLLNEQEQLPKRLSNALDERIDQEISKLGKRLAKDPDYRSLEEIRNKCNHLVNIRHSPRQRECKGLEEQVVSRMEEALYESIKVKYKNEQYRESKNFIAEYKKNFPSGDNKSNVEEIDNKIEKKQEVQLIRDITQIKLNKRASLRRKSDKIQSYLNFIGETDADYEQIKSARALCDQLANTDKLRIRLRSCGFARSAGKRKHRLEWQIGDQGGHTKSSKGTASTFNESIEIRYPNWDEVTIRLKEFKWINEIMAEAKMNLLKVLHRFDGNKKIPLIEKNKWRDADVWFKAQIELKTAADGGWEKVDPDKLQAYAKYVAPGNDWLLE